MRKLLALALLTLALLGGVATFTTLTAPSAHAGCDQGSC
jgi:hypothetical protein